MASIRVHSTLGQFAKVCIEASKICELEMRGVVSEGVKVGNSLGRDNARRTAPPHGKYYPNAFTSEMSATYRSGFAASNVYQGVYGPDASRPQGNMEFEHGSRNQPAHNDLAKSADVVGPAMPREVRSRLDRVFWP